ncbi:TonB-dependent receptor [Mucilaginibacter sp. UYCu711]|uniref:TonB-dependent receptor n=1 Tax=Mucilaginibacter sp. UYCu711 TaxID=3156339 RepID=UPI003D1B29C1
MNFNINTAFCRDGRRLIHKYLLVMKLTVLMLIITLVQVSAKGYSQKITLDEKNAPLEKLLQDIKAQSGYVFFYDAKDVKQKVTVHVSNASIDDALAACLANLPLSYKIVDKTILLQKQEQPGIEKLKPALIAPIAKPISGVVKDEKGLPLPGVSVQVKNKTTGIATDVEGKFSLNVPDGGETLVVSSIGYKTQEVPINFNQPMTIILIEDASKLNEIVVVGYGSQKKANLTGAVDQIGTEYFDDRPVPNVSRALQGAIPNLNLRMTDGKPTRNPSYNVRGATSIGAGGDALVLIDGVQGDPLNLNANDIESVTVLKDAASAAIYGSRGVFGVILITTKSPNHKKNTITYSSNYSLNDRTTKPQWVSDGYLWAKMFNESWSAWYDYAQTPPTVNTFFPFSPGYLDELKNRSENPGQPAITINPSNGNYVYYGNTDWLSELYAKNMPAMEQAISVSGGDNKVDYLVSGKFYQQDGIFKYNPDKFNKYNLRFKGGIQANKWLRITTNSAFSTFKYNYPLQSINQYDVWTNLKLYGIPMAVLLNPDGTLTQSAANNGLGDLYTGKSRSNLTQTLVQNTIGFEAKAMKELNIKGDFTYQLTNVTDIRRLAPISYSTKPGVITSAGQNWLDNNSNKTDYYAANLYADYSHSFGKHNFKALIGGNYERYNYSSLEIQRDGLIIDNLPNFNLAAGQNYKLLSSSNQWATLGGFYRVNYNYDNKYLVEFDGRYDGTSKFPSYSQYGFFPSVSAGWNIAQEKFMASTANWLDEFKLRASYGSLGNSQISPYQYEKTIKAVQSGLILNGSFPTYLQQPAVLADNFTWETATTLNLGLDLSFFKNQLSFTGDIYQRKTTNMITVGQPLPAVFGAAVPKGNFADLTTKGFEISVNWNSQIKTSSSPVKYGVRLTLSDNVSTINKFYNPNGLLSTYYEGQHLGDIWGYKVEGLFASDADIKSHADQSAIVVSSGNKLYPGDIKFMDLNGDNKVNSGKNTLADHGDLVVVGNNLPRYTYGITTNTEWKGFSLTAFFQGVAKRDWFFGNESGIFWGQYTRWYGQIPTATLANTYTIDHPDLNAYFPRYRGPVTAGGRELGTPDDKYLQNVSYIRLKEITLGYNIPKAWVNKIGVANARLYVTGQNLFTYSPMYKITKDIDPEVIENSDPEIRSDMGQGAAYPMLKTYTIGLNVTF